MPKGSEGKKSESDFRHTHYYSYARSLRQAQSVPRKLLKSCRPNAAANIAGHRSWYYRTSDQVPLAPIRLARNGFRMPIRLERMFYR
jgi:hypothetical protein